MLEIQNGRSPSAPTRRHRDDTFEIVASISEERRSARLSHPRAKRVSMITTDTYHTEPLAETIQLSNGVSPHDTNDRPLSVADELVKCLLGWASEAPSGFAAGCRRLYDS